MVAQQLYTLWVGGSNPSSPTILSNFRTQMFRACLKIPRGTAARDIGRGPGGEVGVGAPPEGVQRAVPTGPAPAMTKRPAAQRVFPPQDVSHGSVAVGKCACVVEFGGLPPLFWRQTTVPMLTETAIYS